MEAMEYSETERLAALIERLGRLVYTQAHAENLLPVHWETLRFLHRANRFSRSPAALAAYLGLTKGTVSQTLNTLISKGLLEKRTHPKDRRSRQLALTSRGIKLLEQDPLAQLCSTLHGLDATRRSALVQDLEQVLSGSLIAQGRTPFGQCKACRYFAKTHRTGQPHFCELLGEPLSEFDGSQICQEQQPAA